MSQSAAARLLTGSFYVWRPCPWNPAEKIAYFRRSNGQLILPTKAALLELKIRCDELLGSDFHFDIPLLPKDARYLRDNKK